MRRRNANDDEVTATSPSDDKKEVRPGVGVKGCKLPSPSGINTWSLPAQALTFGIIVTGFVLATKKFSGYLESSGPLSTTPPIVFGALYTALGMTHFVGAKDDMANIVPSYGAWVSGTFRDPRHFMFFGQVVPRLLLDWVYWPATFCFRTHP